MCVDVPAKYHIKRVVGGDGSPDERPRRRRAWRNGRLIVPEDGRRSMDRTVPGTIAIALLVLVAGCGGFGAGGSETPESTAGPTVTKTAAPTASPTPASTGTIAPEQDRYPDGWSAAGIDDPDAALAAHYRATLTGPSVTVTYRSRVREATNERAANTTLSMRADTASRQLSADLDGSDTRREVFFADGTLTRWSPENETVVGRESTAFGLVAQSIDRRVLQSHLLLYTLERNGTVERAGTTALVYDVTGVPDSTVSGTYGTATGASGRIVVGQDGRVFEIETTVTYTDGTVTYYYGHTAVGETAVETPGWMERS